MTNIATACDSILIPADEPIEAGMMRAPRQTLKCSTQVVAQYDCSQGEGRP